MSEGSIMWRIRLDVGYLKMQCASIRICHYDLITHTQFVKSPENGWQCARTIQVTINHCATMLTRNGTSLVPANIFPLITRRNTQGTICLHVHWLDRGIYAYFRDDQMRIYFYVQWRCECCHWTLMSLNHMDWYGGRDKGSSP